MADAMQFLRFLFAQIIINDATNQTNQMQVFSWENNGGNLLNGSN